MKLSVKLISLLSMCLGLAITSLGAFADDNANGPANSANGGIKNLHDVDGAVFRGGRPTIAGLETLQQIHIRAIIDLQGGDIHGDNPVFDLYNLLTEHGETTSAIDKERDQAQKDGIEFFSEPLNSNDSVSPDEATRIDEILTLLHDRQDDPVYVHCAHGVDRTGLVMALYAVKFLGETPAQAHKDWVDYGHTGTLDLFFTGKLDAYFWQVAPAMATARNALINQDVAK